MNESIEERIEKDLKTALLSGDELRVTTLRGLKSTLLNAKVATGKRSTGLSDDEVTSLLVKEAKKCRESANLYRQGGDNNRAERELAEKNVIETYLPAQLSEEDIAKIVDEILKDNDENGNAAMGKIIGEVKARTKGAAEGALIAKVVKQTMGL